MLLYTWHHVAESGYCCVAQDKLYIPNAGRASSQPVVSFINYEYTINAGSILLSRSFSGVPCLGYSFNTSCTQDSNVIGYIADADLFLYVYYENTQANYGTLAESVAGRLGSSVCTVDNDTIACAQVVVPLFVNSYTAYDSGAPGGYAYVPILCPLMTGISCWALRGLRCISRNDRVPCLIHLQSEDPLQEA